MNKLKDILSENYLLITIILFGAILRIYQLSSNPSSLNWDEVSHGYNAYSILKTGKDEWGQTFPTIFRAYGDYKLPIYIYATVIPIAILGLNAFAVRSISMIAGVITILFTYKLAHELFREDKNKKTISLISAFLVATQPWTLFLSRGGFEANLALTLTTSGFYFLVKGLKSPNNLIIGSLLLGLSVWTYNSSRVFTPLMLFVFGFIYFNNLKIIFRNSTKTIIIAVITSMIFLTPMFYQLLIPEGSARYGLVAVIDQGLVNRINEARSSKDLSPVIEKLLINKATYALPVIAVNWASHYTPTFLFLKGGTNYQFSVPERGLMFSVNMLLFYFGIATSFVLIIKRRNTKTYLFILAWLAMGSIASSVTREAPHVLRAITMLPMPMIFISLGLVWFVSLFNSKIRTFKYQIPLRNIFILGFVIINIINLTNYLNRYFNEYRTNYSWSWQYGNGELTNFLKNHYSDYAKIIITKKYGEPHEFILFNWPWDPEDYQDDKSKIRYYQSDWYWVDKFDKFYFVNDWEIVGTKEDPRSPTKFILESRVEDIDCAEIKCLLVTSPGNASQNGWNLIEKILFLNGETAYEIYENI